MSDRFAKTENSRTLCQAVFSIALLKASAQNELTQND